MPIEIERKFRVCSDAWRHGIGRSRRLSDHLVATFEMGKARIRICEEEAILTFKGQRSGLSRSEHHIPFERGRAQALIRDFVMAGPIEKDRHDVEVAGLLWQVDEYRGRLRGFVTADVELPSETFPLVLPAWAGREITHDTRFGSSALLAAAELGAREVERLFRVATEA